MSEVTVHLRRNVSMQTFVSVLFWAQFETLLRSRLKRSTFSLEKHLEKTEVLKAALNIYTLPVWWHNNFEYLVHHQYKCVCECPLHINIHLFPRSAVRCRWSAAIKGRRIQLVCTTPNMDMQGLLAAQSHLQTHASFTAPRTFTISSEAQTTANDPTVITWFTTITKTAIKMYENNKCIYEKQKWQEQDY